MTIVLFTHIISENSSYPKTGSFRTTIFQGRYTGKVQVYVSCKQVQGLKRRS